MKQLRSDLTVIPEPAQILHSDALDHLAINYYTIVRDPLKVQYLKGEMTMEKKTNETQEQELIQMLDKLSPDKMVTVIEYMQKLLIENAAEKVTVCPSCGSGDLSRDDRFIVCDKCGAGGYFKVFDGGEVRVFWEKDREEYRQ